MRTIFHIATEKDWIEAKAKGRYEHPSLSAEGFIHFSRPHQVLATVRRHFPGAKDLVLLEVCQEKVTARVKYEGPESDPFPHVYGALNLDAVLAADPFDGTELPARFQLVGDVLVRPGQPGDEAEIASVHTHAWQQSYRGIVPDSYLDERPLSFRGRLNWWRAVVNGKDPATVFVAESRSHGIVGFCAVCPARDEDKKGHGEIAAIYCLNEYKGKGVGAALFRRGQAKLRELGHARSYLWVLRDNPTAQFYRRMGGAEAADKQKIVELGGQQLVETAFEWLL